jgi:hypothetical protein
VRFDGSEVGLGVEVIAEHGDEMRSRGEAQRADALGIDAPLGGVHAGEAHGLLRVFKILGALGIVAVVGHAILHENAGDVDAVEPGADLGALEVVGEDPVTAAGKDHDRGAAVLCRIGLVDGQRGLADVGEVDDLPTCDERIGRAGLIALRALGRGGLGRAVRPER